jgi:hypothetical protein
VGRGQPQAFDERQRLHNAFLRGSVRYHWRSDTNFTAFANLKIETALKEGGIILENVILSDRHYRLGIPFYREFVIAAGGALQLGVDAQLRARGVTIRGPRRILGQSPYLDPAGDDAVQIRDLAFADIQFQMNNQGVLTFLSSAINGTECIVEKIAAAVGPS